MELKPEKERKKWRKKETNKDFICLGCGDELNHQIAREEGPEVAVLIWLYITVSAFFIGIYCLHYSFTISIDTDIYISYVYMYINGKCLHVSSVVASGKRRVQIIMTCQVIMIGHPGGGRYWNSSALCKAKTCCGVSLFSFRHEYIMLCNDDKQKFRSLLVFFAIVNNEQYLCR